MVNYHPFFGIPSSNNPNFYILGIPWDRSSSFRKGADKGPEEIRKATTGLLYNSFSENLIDLSRIWRYKDLRDLKTENKEFIDLYREVSGIVNENYKKDSIFLFLGGDHSITYQSVRSIKEASKEEFGLIYFDAHPDLYYEYDNDRYSHACVVRRLVEEDIIKPENILQIGIRAATKEQMDFARKNNIKMITSSEIYNRIKFRTDFEKAYLSFDLDVLDPAYAPGVGNPEPGGLSTRELVEIIHNLDIRVMSFDIVELSPPFDYKGITAFAAAKIIREVLGKIYPEVTL